MLNRCYVQRRGWRYANTDGVSGDRPLLLLLLLLLLMLLLGLLRSHWRSCMVTAWLHICSWRPTWNRTVVGD
jgi:hypothetical protein